VEERNHEFYERVFHKRRNCAVCEKAIVGIKRENRTALNCIGCAKIVHKSCLPKIENEKCRSVINNNNNNNIERKNEEGNVCLEDIYCNRGLAYYHDSQYDKAIKDFNKAIQLLSKDDSLVPEEKNKKLCVCYGNKGLAYFYLNNLEKAIKEFTRAMEISSDPVFFANSAQIYSTRATAYQLLGKDDLAEKDRIQSRKLDQNMPVKVFPYALPLELVINTFEFLDRKDLANCMATCSLWYNLITNSSHLISKVSKTTTSPELGAQEKLLSSFF